MFRYFYYASHIQHYLWVKAEQYAKCWNHWFSKTLKLKVMVWKQKTAAWMWIFEFFYTTCSSADGNVCLSVSLLLQSERKFISCHLILYRPSSGWLLMICVISCPFLYFHQIIFFIHIRLDGITINPVWRAKDCIAAFCRWCGHHQSVTFTGPVRSNVAERRL